MLIFFLGSLLQQHSPLGQENYNLVSNSNITSTYAEDSRFQYVLAAATSTATKVNEDTLTYLNQGQSYEIKLKKLGDLSTVRGKMFKVNKIERASSKKIQLLYLRINFSSINMV